ncbi:MAG: hypothetical protein ACI9RG_000520 [Sulfurimonas sp.]|jgi:hypothetical protein
MGLFNLSNQNKNSIYPFDIKITDEIATECITGDEKWEYLTESNIKLKGNSWFFTWTIVVLLLFAVAVAYLIGEAKLSDKIRKEYQISERVVKELRIPEILSGVIVLLLFLRTQTPGTRRYKAKIKRTIYEHNTRLSEIYKYFKIKFPIMHEFKQLEHEVIDVINDKSEDMESLMFIIYMQAYKVQADAIIMNSSGTSTNVYGSISSGPKGSVSGHTYSENEFHIMTTLINFKD